MLHMVAFSASSSPLSALTNIAGVADPVLRVSGNYIYLSQLSNIASFYALGAGTILAAQLQAPSLRRFANIDISPIDTASTPTSPLPFTARYDSPFKLDIDEALQCLITSSGSGQNSVIVELSDAAIAPVSGAIVTVKFTFTAPTGNYSWNNAAITLAQTLPVGNYDCVGARVEGSGCIAARFVPVGSVNRPGILCVASSLVTDPYWQRYGRKGLLFSFNQLTPPTIDLYHVGASGTITGYLDLIMKG